MKNNFLRLFPCWLVFLLYTNVTGLEWEIAGTMPIPVSSGQAIMSYGCVYIIGGYSDSLDAPVNITQIYYPDTGRWFQNAFLHACRSNFAADKFGDQMLIFGGISEGTENLRALEIWDFYSPALVFRNHDIFNRVSANGLVYNEFLYLIGGYPYSSSGDVTVVPYIIEYDILQDSITFVDDKSFQQDVLYQQCAVRLKNNVYIAGGIYYSVSNKIFRFNLNSRSLTQLNSTLLIPRAGGASVRIDDSHMMLIGGYNESEPAMASVEMLEIDGSNVKNEDYPSLVYPRRECMAVVWDEYVFVFGGKDHRGLPVYKIEKLKLHGSSTVHDNGQMIMACQLSQNFPNPFNAETCIAFTLSQSTRTCLEIRTVTGRLVKTLLDDRLSQGSYRYIWDGFDDDCSAAASGIYLYQLKTQYSIQTKKLALIR